jgi:hypothetical protein
MEARLIPGHCLPLCVTCAHRGDDLSHPQPCGRCFWQGAHHHSPSIAVDGDGVVVCGDFAPVAGGVTP